MTRAAGLCILISILVTSLSAQSDDVPSDPTLKETLEFVKDKLSKWGLGIQTYDASSSVTTEATIERIDGTKLVVREYARFKEKEPLLGLIRSNDWREEFRFCLADMDPSQVTLSELDKGYFQVTIRTTDKRKVVNAFWQADLKAEWEERGSKNDVDFYFRDKSIAERCAKALTHAIAKAGGKASKVKKEPF